MQRDATDTDRSSDRSGNTSAVKVEVLDEEVHKLPTLLGQVIVFDPALFTFRLRELEEPGIDLKTEGSKVTLIQFRDKQWKRTSTSCQADHVTQTKVTAFLGFMNAAGDYHATQTVQSFDAKLTITQKWAWDDETGDHWPGPIRLKFEECSNTAKDKVSFTKERTEWRCFDPLGSHIVRHDPGFDGQVILLDKPAKDGSITFIWAKDPITGMASEAIQAPESSEPSSESKSGQERGSHKWSSSSEGSEPGQAGPIA